MSCKAIEDRIFRDLEAKQNSTLFRRVPDYSQQNVIDCASNSYLNFHKNSTIRDTALKLCNGVLFGNLASRLVGQYSPLFSELEQEIADWKKTESALFFNSGYAANTGIIQAICSRFTEVYSDRLNHASIVDGIRLSGAPMIRYKHNDMKELRSLLEKSESKEKIIITDTVFSMDGDVAPLKEICALASEFNCMVMVDEAHASGIFGEYGNGLAHECGVAEHIDIKMGTFSKALAGVGGFFAGSQMIKDYLINNARSLIYSTALPHSSLAFNLASLRYLRLQLNIGNKLLQKAERFRKRLKDYGFDSLNSTTQIVPVVTGNEQQAIALSKHLRDNGIIAPAIRPPTVPAGSSRIRFSLHCGLQNDDLDTITDLLHSRRVTHE